jgi:predicted membrane protein
MHKLKIGSNRSFGIIFFIVFLIIALWPILNSENIRVWSLIISIFFLFLGIFNSKLLTPLNKLWMKFGLLLGKIVSPVVMTVIFFGVVTPTGLVMRIFGKDILKLNKNNNNSYWENKDNSNNNMNNQF